MSRNGRTGCRLRRLLIQIGGERESESEDRERASAVRSSSGILLLLLHCVLDSLLSPILTHDAEGIRAVDDGVATSDQAVIIELEDKAIRNGQMAQSSAIRS